MFPLGSGWYNIKIKIPNKEKKLKENMKRKQPPTGQSGLITIKRINYQSTTGISAGTNRTNMNNLMPSAGLLNKTLSLKGKRVVPSDAELSDRKKCPKLTP